jgi:hypothetical protein
MLLIGKLASEKVARSVVMSANGLYLLVMAVHVHGWLTFFFTR